MHDYEYRKPLEGSCCIALNDFSRHQDDLNQCPRVSSGRWSENLKQLRKHDAVIDRQLSLLSTSREKGLEVVKHRLQNSSDQVKIAALKEALKYGQNGFKLVAKIVKYEKGLVQLTAYDLLWKNVNLRGKQKLLNYLSKSPEVCVNYIEQVLEPSLLAMQKEQEQRHQALAQVGHAQELINEQYRQAFSGLSLEEKSAQKLSLSDLPINVLPDLVLISKLFEAKANQHIFKAQTFAKTIKQIEKALLQTESKWQELDSVIKCDKSPSQLLQLLELLILEMQEHLMLLRQTVARVITTYLQIQYYYNLGKKAATYCKYRAELDWQEGNENWARESLVRRKTYLDTATILKSSLEQQTPQLQVFKSHLFVLQSWLSLAREMKNTLKDVRRSNEIQEAQSLLWRRIEFFYNTSSIMAQLERIKQECLGEQ